MLRQNRSEGSSTSRSFAKTALLRARRKTFQFSDEQFARYIFFTEPLFLIPSVQTEVQESGPTGGAYFFRRNHFSSCRPAEPVRRRGSQGNRVRKGPPHSFEGTTFPRSFRAEIGCPATPEIGSPRIMHVFLREPLFLLPSGRDWRSRKQGHWADQGTAAFFSREPLSLIPLGSRTPVGPQSSLQQFFL